MSRVRLYLGCAKPPFHAQHIEVMGDPSEWVWVDKYVKAEGVKNWDATKLKHVDNNSVHRIYASHLLEHLPHPDLPKILKLWKKKMVYNGELIINVPDMAWAAKQILKHENGEALDDYFTEWEGDHGLQSVVYGSHDHEGEIHKAGFTIRSLKKLLIEAGLEIKEINKVYDAHQMGCLIIRAIK